MTSLKKVLELYKLDWKRVYENKLTLLLVMALMIIPSLYAWFNIAALWDPYSNTKDIKVAVYSEDQTATVLEKKVNIGETMIDNLKDNHTLDWQFVSSRKALEKGVKSGKYYAGIILPNDFSNNLVSFVNGDIKKPHIEYQVNQKINAIAPKITDKGASTIQATISEEFIDTVSQTVFEALNELGYDLDSNLVSINKIADKLLYLDEHMDEIDGYTKEVLALNEKMPEYKDKLAKANEATQYFDKVDALGGKLETVQGYLPEIKKVGNLMVELQGKTDQIKQAGKQIKQVDEDFDDIVTTLNKAIETSKKGLVIIQEAQEMMPEINKFITQANQTLPEVIEGVDKVQTALPQISDGLGTSINILLVVTQNVSQSLSDLNGFLDNVDDTPERKAEIKKILQGIDTQLANQDKVVTTLIETLEKLQETAGSDKLHAQIERLQHLQAIGKSTRQAVQYVIAHIDQMSVAEIQAELTKLIGFSTQLNDALGQVDVEALKNNISQLLTDVSSMLETANGLTQTIVDKDVMTQLNDLLTNTSATIKTVLAFYDRYQKELPAVKEELHTANLMLNDNMTTIVGGINTAANMYQEELPVLEDKLNKGLNFYHDDWPGIKKDVTKTLDTVNEKMPEIEKALALSTEFIAQDWPNLKKGLTKAADLVRKGKKDVDLGEIISLLKKDANDESDFLSNPVSIDQTDVYPIPNYGSASAPFYTALCLWVGAVLFSSIATTEFHLSEKDKKRFSERQKFGARMLTFLTVATAQSLIVALGNIFLLHTYVANPVFNVLFALLVGLVFMAMVYVLVSLFGNLGKGMAVIILVLSISGGGGNFPIQMSGKFFRMINPLLPFTYAVNLLRESVGGIYWPNAIKQILVLIGVAVAFSVIGFYLAPKIKGFFKRLNEKLKEGHLLH